MLTFILICLALGSIVGILAGMLGIGGGLIIVPALVYLLPLEGVAENLVMPMAIATSLGAIIITSASSARAHYKRGNIDFKIAAKLMKAVVIGAFLGALIADVLSFGALTLFFASIVIFLSLQMFFAFRFESNHPLPEGAGLYFIGIVVGVIASLMGIGGGALLVPILTYFALPIRHAMGIASACGICIAIFGSLGFVMTGFNQTDLPEWSLGYIYLPALIGIVTTSFFSAPIGVKIAHALPVPQLKKCFAVFLLFVAGKMFAGILFPA